MTELPPLKVYHFQLYRCLFNMDGTSAEIDDGTVQEIVRRDLIMNVYKNGQWGSFRHLPLESGMFCLFLRKDVLLNFIGSTWLATYCCYMGQLLFSILY